MNCQCLEQKTIMLKKTDGLLFVLYLYIHIRELVTLPAVLNAGLKYNALLKKIRYCNITNHRNPLLP